MGIGNAKWRQISEDSAGGVREKIDAAMKLLPETEAGREFLERYASEDGQIPFDRRIFCKKVRELLEGLDEEGAKELAGLVRFIRMNVSSIIQINRNLKGRKRAFKEYSDYYKRVKDAKFFPDKYFFTKWFGVCANYEQRREVAVSAIKDRVTLGVECFKTLVYDCSGDAVADEVSMFMRKMEFSCDEGFFLFCLRDSCDEVSRIQAIVTAYEKITRKSRSEFFKTAFLRCNSDIDFDWIFSIMRMAGFKLTDQFFVDCVGSAGGMCKRATIHSVHLQRVGFKPSAAFFDAWRGVASGFEAKLVEKYASAGR